MINSLYKILQATFFLYVIWLPSMILAQNEVIQSEFKALNLYYSNVEAFSVDIDVKYFDMNGSVLTQQQGSVCKTKNYHFINMAGVTNLLRNGQHIIVSEGNKTILYSTYNEESLNQIQQNANISAMLDSLWLKQKHLSYKILEQNDDKLKVRINDQLNSTYRSFDILIDTKQHHILSLNYYFQPKPEGNNEIGQISVSYLNETTRPKQNLEKYKIKHYVREVKNNVILTDTFKSYHLIDQSKN